jgi:DNA helicase-2/ATP-dependent DNA helicase PcrA
MQKLLQQLNPVQQEAVKAIEGPVLVLAGAGSGKTRVLTFRIAYLIKEKKIPIENILAVTFTNKAATEMKDRIYKLVGHHNGQHSMWMGTFHSMFARILRRESQKIGYESNYTIYDPEDQLSIIKNIMEDLQISQQQVNPNAIQSRISGAKNTLVYAEDYAQQTTDYFEEITAKVYLAYEKRLMKNNGMDFDDLLLKPIELFEKHPKTLSNYQDRFQFILVDEYQDTNAAQYKLIKLLADRGRNVCVVGDEDQSIYKWRNADIRNILDFQKDYQDAKIFRLEQNYRSTKYILDAAIAVVKNNTERIGKNLWTDKPGGEKITLYVINDETEEAKKVAEVIQSEIRRKKRSFKDFAILYRTNAQSRALEDELRRQGLVYTIVGGIKFYERKEIKDVLAYLRLISNIRDDLSLRRVINYPLRGIGDTTLGRMELDARKQGKSLLEVCWEVKSISEISARTQNEILKFATMIDKYSKLKDKLALSELVRSVVDEIGIVKILKSEATFESLERYENVMELLNSVAEFESRTPDARLDDFLTEVSLITDIDSWPSDRNSITLMSLHSAKGLEFPVIYITGLEEGLFPLMRASIDKSELEEERRLFYVGCTRAMEKLYLCTAKFRRRYGQQNFSEQSRFINEIPLDLLEIQEVNPKISPRNHFGGYSTSSGEDISQLPRTGSWYVGDIVEHEIFGIGRVVAVAGIGPDCKLTVSFEGNVEKKLIARYANLRKKSSDYDYLN